MISKFYSPQQTVTRSREHGELPPSARDRSEQHLTVIHPLLTAEEVAKPMSILQSLEDEVRSTRMEELRND
jgi:hypothetical protein